MKISKRTLILSPKEFNALKQVQKARPDDWKQMFIPFCQAILNSPRENGEEGEEPEETEE